jgi:hypothetical protein
MRHIITRALTVLAVAGGFALGLAGTGTAAASLPANVSGPQYTMVDNYGGNSNGYLTDTGHGQIAQTVSSVGLQTQQWGFYASGTTGWYIVCDASDDLCLTEGSNGWVYLESFNTQTPEQWYLHSDGSNVWHLQNRHYGTQFLSAVSFSSGAQVQGNAHPASQGYDHWLLTCVASC